MVVLQSQNSLLKLTVKMTENCSMVSNLPELHSVSLAQFCILDTGRGHKAKRIPGNEKGFTSPVDQGDKK